MHALTIYGLPSSKRNKLKCIGFTCNDVICNNATCVTYHNKEQACFFFLLIEQKSDRDLAFRVGYINGLKKLVCESMT